MTVISWQIAPGDDDAACAAALRKALREPGPSPLVVRGDFSAELRDGPGAANWLTQLLQAQRPVVAVCDGPLGQRGMAVLLAADIASLGPGASLAPGWRDAPGLAALAVRRGGSALARALLLGEFLTLDSVVGLGLASRDGVEALAPRFDAGFARRKRALRAALELPFGEALSFDLACLDKDAVA